MHERAVNIKLLILDVDGVLTDGLLYYTDAGEAMKSFHARDGLGLRLLLENGIQVALITGRTSKLLAMRAAELKIQHVYQGRINKLEALNELLQELHIDLNDVAFMGDDIIDLPVLSRVGLPAAPQDAHPIVKDHVEFTSQYMGGRGAVRELCDLILAAQNKLAAIVESTKEAGLLLHKANSAC